MRAISAGILMWRRGTPDRLEVLLVHFGGPQWQGRDQGAWGVPKGIVESGESEETCARREFVEELGIEPVGDLVPLGEVRYRSGKRIHAFALEGNLDPDRIRSMEFRLEWPPRSGRYGTWPEIDRAGWFTLDAARKWIIDGQAPLLDRLEQALGPETDAQAPRRSFGISMPARPR